MSSVINVRLNEKMTLRFVELYRDQRLLWDREHEAYNKRTERLRAYRRIADGMAVDGLGVPEVASKIKNIRSTYLQELKKIKDSAQRHLHIRSPAAAASKEEEDGGGGGGGDDDEDDDDDGHRERDAPPTSYVPKLLWFPILDSMIGGAAVKRLYSSPSTAEMLSIDYAEEEDCSNDYSRTDNGGGDGPSATTGNNNKRRRSSGGSANDTLPPKRLQYEQQQSSAELFSKYITTSLEMLPPKLAIRAQKDIHDVLVKYKLIELNQDQHQR